MEKEILQFLWGNFTPQTCLLILCVLMIYRLVLGLRAVLLANISRIYEGSVKNGCIALDAARIVEECYKYYHALWGDGLADNMINTIRSLPTK